jgi:hypothetical protein
MRKGLRHGATGVFMPELSLVKNWQYGMNFGKVDFDQRPDCGIMRSVACFMAVIGGRCSGLVVLLTDESIPLSLVDPHPNVFVLRCINFSTRAMSRDKGRFWFKITDETTFCHYRASVSFCTEILISIVSSVLGSALIFILGSDMDATFLSPSADLQAL